jgi:hypothetical protein
MHFIYDKDMGDKLTYLHNDSYYLVSLKFSSENNFLYIVDILGITQHCI